jgi:RimJ/RimL family protein N-acetyltransferase
MYFGGGVGKQYVNDLVDKMLDKSEHHRLLVAEDDMGQIVGTIHIALMNNNAVEFGVMVAESHRKLGISSKMMEYALTWCRNRNLNDIYMHCLGYNEAIIHLVKKYDLEVTKEYGDADAHVTLPRSDVFSWQHEAVLKNASYVANNIRTFRKILVV